MKTSPWELFYKNVKKAELDKQLEEELLSAASFTRVKEILDEKLSEKYDLHLDWLYSTLPGRQSETTAVIVCQ